MAKYLRVWIDAASKKGTLTIEGTFDTSFGFTLDQGPKRAARYRSGGLQLIANKKVKKDSGNNFQLGDDGEFTLEDDTEALFAVFEVKVEGKTSGDFSNHAFFLKFRDDVNRVYKVGSAGDVIVHPAEEFDSVFVED